MKLDYKNSLVSDQEIEDLKGSLLPSIEKLNRVAESGEYDDPASSINLPADEESFSEVEIIKDSFYFEKLKYILVVGIGGSNLGSQAIYQALRGFKDQMSPDQFPKIIFLDTNNPRLLSALGEFLEKEIQDPEEVVVNIISKSGGTMETVFNAEIVLKELSEKFKGFRSRVVVTTDFNSKLWKIAEEEEISLLAIPDKVGGRFSVFSNVGLFPLYLAGFDVQALLKGALEMRERCLEKDILQNQAVISASVLFLHNQASKNINDNFFFNPELEFLGKWYRQLMGESLGKEENKEGMVVNRGITPTVSVGSTDLHSMGQLYLGGPKDKITNFIYGGNPKDDVEPAKKTFLGELSTSVSGKKASQIMEAILEGTKASYQKKGLPFMDTYLEEINERSLGEYMQFKMMEIIYLADLLEVNAFDQPNVESYKEETRKILRSE